VSRAWSPPNASYIQKRYENRPMKIEDYEPGVSSLANRETNVVSFHCCSLITDKFSGHVEQLIVCVYVRVRR